MKRLLWVLGSALALGGCAGTAPVRFHSLYAPEPALQREDSAEVPVASGQPAVQTLRPGAEAAALPAGDAHPMRVEVRVQVPERLNRSNIVLSGAARDGDGVARAVSGAGASGHAPASPDTGLQVLESARWEAVFGDALQDALAAHLARAAMPVPSAFRLDLKVYRFDVALAGPVDVLLDWSMQRRDQAERADDGNGRAAPRTLSCRYTAGPEVAGADVDAAVRALQQAVGQLAADVARSARLWLKEGRPRCSGTGQADLGGWPATGGQHGG